MCAAQSCVQRPPPPRAGWPRPLGPNAPAPPVSPSLHTTPRLHSPRAPAPRGTWRAGGARLRPMGGQPSAPASACPALPAARHGGAFGLGRIRGCERTRRGWSPGCSTPGERAELPMHFRPRRPMRPGTVGLKARGRRAAPSVLLTKFLHFSSHPQHARSTLAASQPARVALLRRRPGGALPWRASTRRPRSWPRDRGRAAARSGQR